MTGWTLSARGGASASRLAERAVDRRGLANRGHHSRHLDVGGEEARPSPRAAERAVDPEQHRRAADPGGAQQLDRALVGGASAGPHAAADVGGQLHVGGARPRWGGLGGVGPGQGHGTAERQRLDPPHRRLDRRRPIDRDRDHGQVLGEAEQPVGAQRMASAEALDPSQEGARLQVLLGECIEHPVGDEGG